MKKGDVILLLDGRVLRLLDDENDGGRVFKDYAFVQFVTDSETSHFDLSSARIYQNLGQSKEVTAHFVLTHGIHTRLNKLKGI